MSLAASALLACTPSANAVRYAYDAEHTQRVRCCEHERALAGTEALLLLASSVHVCIGPLRRGSPLDPPACRSAAGPTQVTLPRGERELLLWNTNGEGELESEYRFRHDFAAGRIYEVFTVDRGESVEWQLHSVSPERYERLHAHAPAGLRTAPRPPKAPMKLAAAPGPQPDGSMLWPGDDVLPPLQTALLWPCPGAERDPEQALDYPALRAACQLGFLDLDDELDARNVSVQTRALKDCLAERFQASSEWHFDSFQGGDPCRAALGQGWLVPSAGELERLAVESRRHWGTSKRVSALPATLSYVVARDDSGKLVQSAELSEYAPAASGTASLLCVHTVLSVPLVVQRRRACAVQAAEPEQALAADTSARVHQAVETRYAWVADRLEQQLPHFTRENVHTEPGVIQDVVALPERVEKMTQRYAKVSPPISLRHPRGSPVLLRLRESLREVAELLEPGAGESTCIQESGDKRACLAALGDSQKAAELRHALRRLGIGR